MIARLGGAGVASFTTGTFAGCNTFNYNLTAPGTTYPTALVQSCGFDCKRRQANGRAVAGRWHAHQPDKLLGLPNSTRPCLD